MKKSILRLGALALMSMMSISTWAQQGSTDEAFYSVTSDTPFKIGNVQYAGEVTITAAKSNEKWGAGCDALTISGKLYLITGIGNDAFKGYPNAVKIPKYVKTIGTYAYQNAKVLPADASNTFDFSNVVLSEGSFFNADFYAFQGTGLQEEAQTIIKMGEMAFGATSLPKKVFGVEQGEGFPGTIVTKNDILAVTFEWSNTLTKVDESALEGRAGLTTFGWANSGAYYLPKGLTEVGDRAFAGCSNLFNFRYTSPHAGIYVTKVGKYAFAGCTWLNNAALQNVCGSFEGLEFAEGSFYGCGLTSVDLSKWAVVEDVMTIVSGKNVYKYQGIPANAFYGNPITSLKYPANLIAIGNGAFCGNRLKSISLPEGLEYVGASALESAEGVNAEQELLLPLTLKKIFAKGIGNRTFTGIYAHPDIVGNVSYPAYEADKSDNTIYTLYVPTKAPWTEEKATKTVKMKYADAGWNNIKYVELNGNRQTGPVDNTLYSITGSNNGDVDNGGYYPGKVDSECRVKKDDDKTMTVRGMVSFGNGDVTVDGVTYCYPQVVKIDMPNAIPANEFVTEITFEPQSVANDIYDEGAEKIASEFVSGITDFAIPANAFNAGWKSLTKVTFKNGVAKIGDNAFKDTGLTTVTFDGIEEVGVSAFANTKITEVTLPASLKTIGKSAFDTQTLKKVNVSYAAKNLFAIPEDAFYVKDGTFTALLNVTEATREDYLLKNGWKLFFDNTVTVNVTKNEKDAKPIRIATIDGEKGARIYQLKDAGDIAKVSVTGVPEKGAPKVQYIRNFNNDNFQAWYVPFDYTYKGSDDFKFYYIYDTKQSDFTADGTTSIELKEVALNKDGKATIKANTPYVIKATAAGELTFDADAIKNTVENNTITVGNVQNQFTFTGIYARKTGVEKEEADWYALSGGKLDNYKGKTKLGVNAYRFYMTYKGQTNPYGLVKFVVLDDEDATAIENVKANSLNAPMFDLMGRQIAAPVKGQIYIQNGVKRLAK